MALIDVQNLTKRYRVADKSPGIFATLRHLMFRRYRYIDAVQDVSFTLEPGEIVGFLGPNGAGKTTTLKMLSGLLHPSSGEVRVADHVPFRRSHAFLEQITLVMGQKQQLIWDLPAMDSLRINAAVYSIEHREFERRVGELNEMLALDGALRQPVRKLSLGQRMKAELLAALLHRPRVLFLDEPTLGLDVNAQASVREFLRDYNHRYDATILLTSHYMADITALCRRVMLIHEGRLRYDGPLDGLTARLAPHRLVNLEFDHPLARADLEQYGDVAMHDGAFASILVPRDQLPSTLNMLLDAFGVVDVTVSDPPIEQTIGRFFREADNHSALAPH